MAFQSSYSTSRLEANSSSKKVGGGQRSSANSSASTTRDRRRSSVFAVGVEIPKNLLQRSNRMSCSWSITRARRGQPSAADFRRRISLGDDAVAVGEENGLAFRGEPHGLAQLVPEVLELDDTHLSLQNPVPALALRDRALSPLQLRHAPVAVLAHHLHVHGRVLVHVAGPGVARAVPLLGREAALAQTLLGVFDDLLGTDVIAIWHDGQVCNTFSSPWPSSFPSSTTSSSATFTSRAARPSRRCGFITSPSAIPRESRCSSSTARAAR